LKLTYDHLADAAYIYLVQEIDKGQVKKTYLCDPSEIGGQINLDFDASGTLLGIEILDASRFLSKGVLDEAEIIE